jgi:SNF2 family DNA or RNA helicase
MNIDGTTYLIYDKFAGGDHGYKNQYTQGITIEQVFSSNIVPLEGQAAITEFNNYGGIYNIPQQIDLQIYNLHFFVVPIDKTISAKIMIVSINNELFENSVKNHNFVPNEQFIINACSYHIAYTKIPNIDIADSKTKLKTSVDEIVKKSTEPNADVTDQIVENPQFAKQPMWNYQKRTVKWMLTNELKMPSIHYSLNAEILIGDIVFDSITKKFSKCEDRKKIVFRGGALIDEVGLGKTYQMLALSLLNRPSDISYYKVPNRLCSRATLVICPNHLCVQWSREITKMIKDEYKISVVLLLTKNHHDKYTYLDLLDADFVIVSYNFLGNQCYLSQWLPKVSKLKSYCSGVQFDIAAVKRVFDTMEDVYLKSPEKLFETKTVPNIIYWNRVIIDEFHEVFSVVKYRHMSNLVRFFNGVTKWCVTGTPFDKGSDCLVKMIDHVTHYTNTIGDKILVNDDVKNYMLKSFFRRNTKKSVMDEYKLDPLIEQIIWLKFSPTERMLYNAYLVNPNIDKFSVLMRQLCCHPGIADEIKDTISNCKTPEDIENMMVKHYKTTMDAADKKVRYIEYRIRKTERKIKVAEFRRQKRFIKQLNYKVVIEYPPDIKDPEFDNFTVDVGLNDNENDNVELFDDDDDDDDDKKPVFIISDATQKDVMKLINAQLAANKSATIAGLHELIMNWRVKLLEAKKDLEGKRITYEFFSNVMDRLRKTGTKKVTDEVNEDEEEVCGICLGVITGEDVGVTKCGHIYCYQCLKDFIVSNPKCPMCSKPVKKEDIFLISYETHKKNELQTKEIKDKISLISRVGTKLANLIFYIKSIKDKVIIFSQWDDLLRKVGDVLDTYGIKNVFCRGNVWMRDKAIREFTNREDMRVIMLSSDSAASGTNLTAASVVILLDPVYGSYEYRRNTEWQAIGRAYRMGQLKKVTVVRMIIKNSVEEEIYNLNKKEDDKFTQQNAKIFELEDDKITLEKNEMEIMAKTAEESLKKKETKKVPKKEKVPKKGLVK